MPASAAVATAARWSRTACAAARRAVAAVGEVSSGSAPRPRSTTSAAAPPSIDEEQRTGRGFLHFQYSRHSVRGRAWADVVEDLKRLVTRANPPVAPPTTAELAPGVQEFVNNNFDMPDDKISKQSLCVLSTLRWN
eukprot:TRINITY_DN659_c0_g2_i3.p1 TRINITY_DN659_c0_g2~~TRINITY_DN659_c0_g2_i3.p1  ORF type:complete len:136 (+),score=22.10 TRINITY_DN659_c0_g2_i3:456-863(+)